MRRAIVIPLLLLLLAPAPFAAAQTGRDGGGERTIADSELINIAPRPCGSESNLKSLSGDTRSFLRFRNKTAKDVTYYWINYEGKRDQKRTLKPGEEYSLWTYLTHPFVVVNAKGQCTAVYMPQKEYGLIVFSEVSK